MGNLSQYAEKIQRVQDKLDDAGSVDSILENRFSEVNANLDEAMKNLVDESNKQQNEAFRGVVERAVLAVTQNNQIVLNSLNRMSQESESARNSVKNDISGNSQKMQKNNQALTGQLDALNKQIAGLPTQFPEQIKTDLSGIEKGIRHLMSAISSIPMPEYPKQADMSPQFKRIEKQLIALKKKPNHEFIVHRNSDDLVTKVTAKAI